MPSIKALYVVREPSDPPVRLPAELLDLVCEAVLDQEGEAGRSAVSARLIREIYDSLAWLHPDPADRERASFQRVVGEMEAHQARLGRPPGSATGPVKSAG